MMIPRDYQVQAVESIFKYFSNNTGNPLLCLPTGTGKSVIIAMLLKKIFEIYPNQKVLMITHVKELIQQNYEKLKAVWNIFGRFEKTRKSAKDNILWHSVSSKKSRVVW